MIKIEATNNAGIVKFATDRFFGLGKGYEFGNIDEAKNSPLAQELFYLPFVKKVYIAQNFVAVEKYDIVAWPDVQEELAEQLQNYIASGKPVVVEQERGDKVPVTVYAESTPNPAVLKFVANKPLADGQFEFKNIDESHDAPLVQALFHFPFVKEVFVKANYVSVMKYDMAEWQDITAELREFIRNYLQEGKQVFNDGILRNRPMTPESGSVADGEPLDDTSKEIVRILEKHIQPAVSGDGGHIAFQSYDANSGKVKVQLQGACSGCPSSTFTLKQGMETLLKDMMGDKVSGVEAIAV